MALRLRGALDEAALQSSFDALIARHETLRTRFVEGAQGLTQVIEAQAACGSSDRTCPCWCKPATPSN